MIFSVGEFKPQIHPTAFVHPTAEVSGKVKIGPRASIWGGCILRGDVDWIEIGEESNVQDGSVFHTSHNLPVKLGKGVTIGHKVVVHGSIIHDYTLIGMGAVLLDGSVIETNCLIGAGAVVREKAVIPAGNLAVGTPAKVVRALKPEETKMILDRPGEYVQLTEQYVKALKAANLL